MSLPPPCGRDQSGPYDWPSLRSAACLCKNRTRTFLRQQGWTLEQAVDGKLIPIQEDEFLPPPVHTVWWRNAGTHPGFQEALSREKVVLYQNGSKKHLSKLRCIWYTGNRKVGLLHLFCYK